MVASSTSVLKIKSRIESCPHHVGGKRGRYISALMSPGGHRTILECSLTHHRPYFSLEALVFDFAAGNSQYQFDLE